MSSRLTSLELVVAEAAELSADLNALIEQTPAPIAEFLSVETSTNIAEQRTRSAVADVHAIIGVKAELDVVIIGTRERVSGLQVYVKSEQLQVGASALYSKDGDEVESVLYVEDGDILHPEFIAEMTASLLFRGTRGIGTVTFDRRHGNEDGTVTSIWPHPAHREDLTIRYIGTIENLGDVDFTVPVSDDTLADAPLSENVLEGVDIVAPRTEPDSTAVYTRVLDPAPEEVDVLHPQVVLVLFRLNLLSQYEFLEAGTGPIEYSGGGNRLLSALRNDAFVFQAKDEFPPGIDAHTRIELASSNLLTNTNFLTPTSVDNPVPLGWSLDAPGSVTLLPELVPDSSGVNQLKIRALGSGPYVGPKAMTFSQDVAVPASPADPLAFSVLARTEIANQEVVVDDLRLIISFRDSMDAEISAQVAEFAPFDILGASLVLLQLVVPTPPTGTMAARVAVEMDSIEGSDDINLFLMAPQVETNTLASSRIVGSAPPVTRATDTLRVPQKGNLEPRRGSIITLFAPDYEGAPAADACLFDTRDAAGLNGFAVFHRANGRLRFVVGGPLTPKELETNLPFSFPAGIFQEVGVSWKEGFLEIQLNSERVAVDENPTVLPQAFNDHIYLFRTTADMDRLNGELATFEIRRDIQKQ